MKSYKVLMLMVHSFFIFCFTSTFSNSHETVTVTPNQSIQEEKTLVSEAGNFEAGFFSFGNSQLKYFGIWYKEILPRTIVWVANRKTPVQNSRAILNLTVQGNLVILDGSSGIVVWSSNSSIIAEKPLKPVMQLLNSGNLVVKDEDSTEKILWEIFDYPGDTFLAGMKLKSNVVTGPYRSLTSWRGEEDPAPGEFSYHIDSRGFPQLVTTKGTTFSNRAGSWNGFLFSGVPWLPRFNFLNFSWVSSETEVSYEYEILNGAIVSRLVLNPSGISQRSKWSDSKKSWEIISTRPMDQCEYYAFCGNNSICNITNSPICECLEGFIPKFQAKWNSSDWSGGCVRRTNFNCHNGDGFLMLTGMKLPDTSSSWFDKGLRLEKCKTLCLKNCTCTAYANSDIRDGGSGCLLWFGNIVDLAKDIDQGQDFYIRLAASELDQGRNKRHSDNKKLVGILVGSITFIIIIIGLATFTCMKRKMLKKSGMLKAFYWKEEREKEDISLRTIFDFSTISTATNHFAQSNKLGQGGFRPVYKGILTNGQEIAVKRLSKTSEQGIEELKNEVMLMATLQHRNLIKLLGCSIQQHEKLLIYEFMPNRSLDYFIFDSMQSKLLDWTKRFQIINGIARGLLYLHQDSRLRIIHIDLKTSNILLDNNINPKISDFGLAKTFGGDQAEANTNRVMGTYGYMPPEYAIYGSFSIKSDVFSFGVIVLEIISGRRNRQFCDPDHHLNLLGHAWRLWIEEKPLELMDDILHASATPSEILRCIHVGLLCVQQRPENRPRMSSVVLMLNGEKLLPKPSQPGFYTGTDHPIQAESSSRSGGNCSNEMSVSLLEAR